MRDVNLLFRMLWRSARPDIALTVLLTAASAVAEIVTIGAAVPFLLLATDLARLPQGPGRWLASLEEAGNPLVAAAFFLALMAVVAATVRLLLAWSTQRLAVRLGRELAGAVFSQALHRPYSEFVRRNSSDILSGIEKVQAVTYGLMQPAIQGAVAAVLAACIGALLFALDPLTAAIGTGSILIAYGVITAVTSRRLVKNTRTIGAMMTERTKTVQESMGHIRDIMLDRSQHLFEERFRLIDGRHRRAVASNAFMAIAPRFVIEAIAIVALAMVTLAMSYRPGGFIAAIPILGTIALGAQRLLPLVQTAWQGWSQATGNMQLLKDLGILVEAEPVARVNPPDPWQFRREIKLDRVSFAFVDNDPVIEDVSLTIRRGERIGIVGTTGSGKSTLLDLLMGLLTPTRGQITIDGEPLVEGVRERWQAAIAHVPQSVYLSDDTITANIALLRDDSAIDMERVRKAVSRAQLDAFVDALPEGLQTRVGERGVRLSGGQRQRIAMARAVYKSAPVVVLDEPTSALDVETEMAVLSALAAHGPNQTVIIVSHRRSSLAMCDRIFEIDGGKARCVEHNRRLLPFE